MQRFNIFRSQTIELAKSLVIKSETIADEMNKWVQEQAPGVVISNDKATWRYFLHLAGRKHAMDTPIYLRSLDTNETIELTIDNLYRHKKTRNVYHGNVRYIDQLIEQHPDHSIYIKGCFNPIPLTVSLAAQDCAILFFDQTLVEQQELGLIGEIEKWIRSVHVRYMAEGWRVHNDCFSMVFYAILFSALPGRIMFERMKRNHLPEAHSFLVTEFLASHQELHEYVPYMTRDQLYMTYRNIRTWERSSGQDDTFAWLVDTFFTGWDMPAVAYNVAQLTHDPSTGKDEDVVPRPTAFRQAINFTERTSGRDLDLVSTADVIYKEYPLASANPRYMDQYQNELNTRLSLTQYPVQPTKLVEITAIDPESLERYDRVHAVWNEWVHMVMLGKYNIMHEFVNPTTGDTLRLSSKELIALYLYAGLKGYADIELMHAPEFAINGVLIKRWVPFDEMETHLVPNLLGRFDSLIHYYTDTHYEQASQITDAAAMYDAAMEIWQSKQRRWTYGMNRLRIPDRAAAGQLFLYHYRDYKVRVDLGWPDYPAFFKALGIDYKIISSEAWRDIATDAFNIGTDYDNKRSISQSEIQRAMVSVMTKLSSYSIHFASRMAGGEYEVTDPVVPILDDIGSRSEGSHFINVGTPEPVHVEGHAKARVDAILGVGNVFPENRPSINIPSNPWFMFNLLPAISVSIQANTRVEATGFLPDVIDVNYPGD